MPVIVMMSDNTFKVLSNEPRDQIIRASMGDYQAAIDAGQATPWREPPQFVFPQLPPSTPTYAGQPLYPMGGATVGQSTGYAGGGYAAPAPRYDTSGPRYAYAPAWGAAPTYPPTRPTPLAPDVMTGGPVSVGQPAPTNASYIAPQQQGNALGPGYEGVYAATIAYPPQPAATQVREAMPVQASVASANPMRYGMEPLQPAPVYSPSPVRDAVSPMRRGLEPLAPPVYAAPQATPVYPSNQSPMRRGMPVDNGMTWAAPRFDLWAPPAGVQVNPSFLPPAWR